MYIFINFFVEFFHNNAKLATSIISALPLIELRGAIPFGMSEAWGMNALNGWEALFYALVGSCLVVPILALLFTPIINWLKKTKLFCKFASAIDQSLHRKSQSISKDLDDKNKKYKYFLQCLGVFAFVSVPLPLTGIWTGTCIAVILGLRFRDILLSVILGNICAGLIMTLISSIGSSTVVFISYLVLILVFVCGAILKHLFDKKKHKGALQTQSIFGTSDNSVSQQNDNINAVDNADNQN